MVSDFFVDIRVINILFNGRKYLKFQGGTIMQIFTYFMIAIIAILGTAALVYYTKLEAMKEQYELMKEQYEIRLAELKEKK